jgi:hypothetical protein
VSVLMVGVTVVIRTRLDLTDDSPIDMSSLTVCLDYSSFIEVSAHVGHCSRRLSRPFDLMLAES